MKPQLLNHATTNNESDNVQTIAATRNDAMTIQDFKTSSTRAHLPRQIGVAALATCLRCLLDEWWGWNTDVPKHKKTLAFLVK